MALVSPRGGTGGRKVEMEFCALPKCYCHGLTKIEVYPKPPKCPFIRSRFLMPVSWWLSQQFFVLLDMIPKYILSLRIIISLFAFASRAVLLALKAPASLVSPIHLFLPRDLVFSLALGPGNRLFPSRVLIKYQKESVDCYLGRSLAVHLLS